MKDSRFKIGIEPQINRIAGFTRISSDLSCRAYARHLKMVPKECKMLDFSYSLEVTKSESLASINPKNLRFQC